MGHVGPGEEGKMEEEIHVERQEVQGTLEEDVEALFMMTDAAALLLQQFAREVHESFAIAAAAGVDCWDDEDEVYCWKTHDEDEDEDEDEEESAVIDVLGRRRRMGVTEYKVKRKNGSFSWEDEEGLDCMKLIRHFHVALEKKLGLIMLPPRIVGLFHVRSGVDYEPRAISQFVNVGRLHSGQLVCLHRVLEQRCQNMQREFKRGRHRAVYHTCGAAQEGTTVARQGPDHRALDAFISTLGVGKVNIVGFARVVNDEAEEMFNRKLGKGQRCLMFHGCRSANNEAGIINEGFQVLHCRAGGIGFGTWVAYEASYSNAGYCYYDGTYSHIFVVEVPTGFGWVQNSSWHRVVEQDCAFPRYLIVYKASYGRNY